MHRHPTAAAVPVLILAFVLAACGQGTAPSSAAATVRATPSASADASASIEPSASADASGDAAEVRVRLDGFAFDPEELTVAAGTKVTFLNTDPATHTVTEGTDGVAADGAFINDELAANQATSHTFDEPGTYHITCLKHPTMNMTITVTG
ncbi:MAG TPA: plastocyanin/azurin family copper-binding protein [Candidatus Limnocylindria bacterium]|nr:plastocyanin/azurin family copper-binding protein [Candidatus Limnocylindria bacterium]